MKTVVMSIPPWWLKRNPQPIAGALRAVNVFVFWTHDGGSWLSRIISRVTKCPWSHCGIGFVLRILSTEGTDNTEEKRVYFEALFSGGFQGPKPWSHITDWVHADERERRKLFSWRLGTGPEIAEEKLALCAQLVGLRSYSAAQLLAMYFFEKFGWGVPRSDDKVVCSEIVGRILYPEFDLRSDGRTFDEITPCSIFQRVYDEMLPKSASHEKTQKAQGPT
jgi:hypothetical protein